MALELERSTAGGVERIIVTCDSNDLAALQDFTEEQHALGFDIGSGNSITADGKMQRTYTRPVALEPEVEVEAEPEVIAEPEEDDDQEEAMIDATDGALALAEENDIDLEGVVGTGAGGRIVVDDVRSLLATEPETAD